MASPFKDFIPAGQDTGAQGSGFKDFVPEGENKPVVATTEVTTSVYADKKVKELRAIAKEKGLDVEGLKKEEIVKALEDADAVLPEPQATEGENPEEKPVE